MRKNFKKTLIIAALTAVIIYLDMVVLESFKEDLGMENPDTIIDYLSGRFSLFGMLLMISACAFFGSIIVEDNEKRTGNILFPKIGKDRLIIGRYFALFLLFTVIIILYYVAISVSALIIYDDPLPIELFESFGWCLFYALALSSFVTLISSISKSVNMSVIISVILLLMVFDIVSTVIMFSGSEIEPLFLITYNFDIITSSLKFPDPRFRDMDIYAGVPGLEGNTYRIWLTPSPEGAAISMLIYTIGCLVLAYFFYRRKD